MSRFKCSRTGKQAARFVLVVIGAASLAACMQTPVAQQRPGFVGVARQAAIERRHEVTRTAGVYVRRAHHPRVRAAAAAKPHTGGQGVASFYSDEQETASGEKFDKNELTAAHPSLPFGTRLRVTNVSTGRSVTVRVNDRGPYVHGRVVDVSYSAAEALGMVHAGVANVKLDVVR
jgi:rare lipoprotein A